MGLSFENLQSYREIINLWILSHYDETFTLCRVQARGGKATYSILGTTIAAPHHNPNFDIDEQIFPAAVDLLLQIATQSLK